MWVFGYGSIVWKTGFVADEKEELFGYVKGFHRRFYQGSPDHRGVPDALGRVATLITHEDMPQFNDELMEEDPIVWGRIYKVADEHIDGTLDNLDNREKAGYARYQVDVHCTDGEIRQALVYIATPNNPTFLGPAPIDELAYEILTRHGPSGPNFEYFYKLQEVMKTLQVHDPHLEAIEEAISRLQQRDVDALPSASKELEAETAAPETGVSVA